MLIWKNCMAYNKPETLYYRTAERLKKVSIDLINQANQDYNELLIRKETGVLSVDIHPEIFTYNTVHVPSPEELAAERERLEQEEKARLEQEEQERLLAERLEAKKKVQLEREKAKEKQEEVRRKRRADQAIRRERIREEKLKAKLLQEQQQQEEGGEQVVMDSNKPSSRDAEVPGSGRITTRSSRAKAIQKEKETVKEEEKEGKEKQARKRSLRRRTRSMGSDGLVAPTAEQVQRRTSSEARNLLWHSDSVAAEQDNVPPLKLDLKRKAPPGWRYVEENSSNNNSDVDSPAPSPRKKPRIERVPRITKLEPITNIKHKMIVWARVKGFPPHPAKVVIICLFLVVILYIYNILSYI